ncbi:segregation/condensation protein A [Bacteroidetes/Chlorobi group bacterium ChocPot_Mid]|jgi:segregation and condensation protein A|nr:MAG: segregation/condensation protein A [Bacteroidetes/Chlorobi group bacterium ChocPot_Mid]
MYKIRLPNFEGPFDLLLYFIKRDELNIYDIPIAKITEEYLKYIRLMRFFDLELAGEFLVMVTTLMYIKAQMLLPKAINENGEEIEDPRTILVQKLIEYKQFKEASFDLQSMAENQKYVYYRKLFAESSPQSENPDDVYYENSTLFDLLKAFKIAIERSQGVITEHIVNIKKVSIAEKASLILQTLKINKRLSFFNLVKNENRSNILITFLAILEMIKDKLIFIVQDSHFEDIVIIERPDNVFDSDLVYETNMNIENN